MDRSTPGPEVDPKRTRSVRIWSTSGSFRARLGPGRSAASEVDHRSGPDMKRLFSAPYRPRRLVIKASSLLEPAGSSSKPAGAPPSAITQMSYDKAVSTGMLSAEPSAACVRPRSNTIVRCGQKQALAIAAASSAAYIVRSSLVLLRTCVSGTRLGQSRNIRLSVTVI